MYIYDISRLRVNTCTFTGLENSFLSFTWSSFVVISPMSSVTALSCAADKYPNKIFWTSQG